MNAHNPEHLRQAFELRTLAQKECCLSSLYSEDAPKLSHFGFRLPDINDIWKTGSHFCTVICVANERSKRLPVCVVFQLQNSADIVSLPVESFLSRFEFVREEYKNMAGSFPKITAVASDG